MNKHIQILLSCTAIVVALSFITCQKKPQNNIQETTTNSTTKNRPIQVYIDTIFYKSTQVVHPRNSLEESAYSIDTTTVNVLLAIPQSNIPQIDNVLINHAYNTTAYNNLETSTQQHSRSSLKTLFNDSYQEMLQYAKMDSPYSLELSLEGKYLGITDNNIATFSFFLYTYEGGAHGIYDYSYIHIDTDEQTHLSLSDVFTPSLHPALEQQLWNNYIQSTITEGHSQFSSREEFYISPNYHFTPESIIFIYPLYTLWSYAEGEGRIILPKSQANQFLSPKYRYK